ncbi:SIMPL domain-containing protein [Patescibacteria group bacterium]|nr:SIMPL domain-containing protein [Patescibacteria group bacterium]MBU4275027.1 SIMPL domain-containing protein [Patescibacteria group bacterium]MBU4367597.1 SIMPL domain-containing protein [Patescibacteria group bacterium]MBU4462066.1 SIMPL domain-containing protein [Patescibacteria group bacterium]MCG2700452.1 SIMPL domain-containing protein [Candidatus Parcubacteria bacterium]
MAEEKQIDLSYRLFILALVLITVLTVSYLIKATLDYRSIPGNQPREITVSGEGKVYATPDIATVQLGVTNEGDDISVIVQKNTETMNSILKDIKDLGIDEKDIKTTQYSLSPRYDWIKGERVFKGYIITQQINVKIRDFTKIGDVLGTGTENGATLVGDLSFSIDDPEKARQEAREEAIAKAKIKAENIAEASGLKIIKLLNVQESSYDPYYYNTVMRESGLGGAIEAPVPEIQPGQQEVTITVYLTYRIR